MATQRFYDGQPGPDIRRELNNFEAILDGTVASAQAASTAATSASAKAQQWADAAPGVEVETGKYSAKHWADRAQTTVTGGLIYRGSHSAASGAYPATPSLGDYYKISAAGTLGGVDYSVGDSIIYNGTGWDKIDSTDAVTSVAGRVGAVVLTKGDVGLGNVDNTSDANKPVSTATQTALNAKVAKSGDTMSGALTLASEAIPLTVNNLPTLRPSLLLDFANSEYVDPRITFTRASTATRINERGLIEVVAANVPRIDFDPVTGACKGWLIEEQRTNYITNNTMQGVVVGSPGTTPTGWSGSGTGSGITRTVVATGVEDGISYVDVRFDGTPTVNNATFVFTAANAIAAASGQMWAISTYLRLVGGSFANTTPALDILETDGTNGVGTNLITCVATSAPLATQRFVNVTTVDAAGVTHVQPRIRVGLTTGQPVDFTLRIGMPQFEAGGFATSVIPTAGAAATRAADAASMTGTNFSEWYRQDEGTVVCEYSRSSDKGAGNQIPFMLSDGSGNNIIAITDSANGTGDRVLVTAGGVGQSNFNITNYTPNQRLVRAIGFKQDSVATSLNGSAAVEDTSALVPVVNQLSIGYAPYFNSSRINGHIRRIAYYPKRLANAELQALTAP